MPKAGAGLLPKAGAAVWPKGAEGLAADANAGADIALLEEAMKEAGKGFAGGVLLAAACAPNMDAAGKGLDVEAGAGLPDRKKGVLAAAGWAEGMPNPVVCAARLPKLPAEGLVCCAAGCCLVEPAPAVGTLKCTLLCCADELL